MIRYWLIILLSFPMLITISASSYSSNHQLKQSSSTDKLDIFQTFVTIDKLMSEQNYKGALSVITPLVTPITSSPKYQNLYDGDYGARLLIIAARLQAQIGKYQDAQKTIALANSYLNKIIELYKDSKVVQTQVGTIKFRSDSLKRILAKLFMDIGQYDEADQLLGQIISSNSLFSPIYDKAKSDLDRKELSKILGPSEMALQAKTIGEYGTLNLRAYRYENARKALQYSISVNTNLLGKRNKYVAAAQLQLGKVEIAEGNWKAANKRFKAAIKGYGRRRFKSLEVAEARSLLGFVLLQLGNNTEAEVLVRQAMDINQAVFGEDNHIIGANFHQLAKIQFANNDLSSAKQFANKSISAISSSLGENHLNTVEPLLLLSRTEEGLGNSLAALSQIRRATKILSDDIFEKSGNVYAVPIGKTNLYRRAFAELAMMTHRLSTESSKNSGKLLEESFIAVQMMNRTVAARAVASLAARYAAQNDSIGELARQRQSLAEKIYQFNSALISEMSQQSESRIDNLGKELQNQLDTARTQIKELDQRLTRKFPEYASLMTMKPINHKEIGDLLGNDEFLVRFMFHPEKGGLAFVISKSQMNVVSLSMNAEEVGQSVEALREGLDQYVETTADIIPFDTNAAYEFYTKLFKPIEPYLKGARHIFIVSEGVLLSLPIGVLVTAPTENSINDFRDYRNIPWLMKRYSTTILPSISSLKYLRQSQQKNANQKPFLGIGNPDFEGSQGNARGFNSQSLFASRGVGNLENIRALAQLPETEGEVREIARTLGAGTDSLLLGAEATETNVKKIQLSDYRVLVFATHGLVAGDFETLGEPALALTPPLKATKLDDGLLTASEIAQLNLKADWVVLSACNTASPDGTANAQGLSGLTRGFIFAGTRSLLVSHWLVGSEAARRLTSRTFQILKENPTLGRSEAFHNSMNDLMNSEDLEYFSHPMFWAPFSLVGEGGEI